MDALTLLTTRRSNKKLTAPAPNKTQLKHIFQAALRTPDHGKLQPYHFVVIENEGLHKLEELLKEAVLEFNLGEERLKKAENLAHRAPMVIAVIAKITPDIPKVPEWEQLLTAGCAAYGIQLAAHAQGFDNVWITGKWVEGTALRQALGCREQDNIVALLMLGTAIEKVEREARQESMEEFVSYL
ncbi:NAD(P)H nitroreductase [Rodentibacter trehalosifermentans]|uniref:Putative NAD(P)H nitroreductase n=1 Tax=Rodentibacter trehalosifermentans TaxID=1908263 RepID=A0A1V3J2I4_9PAST|nr:NAD(P)H nitroreductase [Rodentibacter trehalosifermentans]OOF47346.1 nitroreductase [Rodentibacter trehalosifermentans]OOF49063.1 nitroreductase [Rodentibacter trehalosifermentans]OOF52874.1 nitroreductase [Rodentibacter trehalosifermentans]